MSVSAGTRWLGGWRFWLVLAATALGLLAPPLAQRAFADDPRPQDVTITDLGLGDVTIQGVRVVSEVFFPGPVGFAVAASGHYLELIYSHSPLLRPDVSTMTLQLNGQSLTAVALTESNTDATTLRVDLPAALIDPLFNRITFQMLMRIDAECDEPDNPALFTRIHGASRVHYNYAGPGDTRPPASPDLAALPVPYLRQNYPIKTDTVFVVPPDPRGTELTAAASIAGRFGQIIGASGPFLLPTRFTLASVIPADLAADAALISIGEFTRNPLLAQAGVDWPVRVDAGGGIRLPDGALLTGAVGLIQAAASPFSETHEALLVTGADDTAMDLAVQTLAGGTASTPLGGQYALIRAVTGRAAPGTDHEGGIAITFEDLDVPDSTQVTGIGTRFFTVSFLAPAPAPGRVELVLEHSRELDPARANVVVTLNGLNLDTIALNFDRGERRLITVPLPASSLRPGFNTLTLSFGLHLRAIPAGPFSACGAVPLPQERSWVTVHPQSRLFLPQSSQPLPPDLDFYPFPFLDEFGDPADTVVVAPAGTPEAELVNLAFDLGTLAKVDPFVLRVVPLDEITDADLADHNVILLGRPSRHPLIAEAGDVLPLRFDAETDRIVESDINFDEDIDPTAELGALMVAVSPWNPRHTLLVVTGTTDDAVFWARRALGRRQASGPITLITGLDQVRTFPIPQDELVAALAALTAEEQDRSGFALGGAFLVMVGAAGLLGIFWLRTRGEEDLRGE